MTSSEHDSSADERFDLRRRLGRLPGNERGMARRLTHHQRYYKPSYLTRSESQLLTDLLKLTPAEKRVKILIAVCRIVGKRKQERNVDPER
jgi:hypothetical protein